MSRFRLYIASSLDGYAAPSDGSVDWLADYPAEDMGFPAFFEEIDTIVMGRSTYQQIRAFPEWPYAGRRVCVLSSGPIDDLPEGAEWSDQTFAALAERFRAEARGDVWIVGGPETIHRAFVDDVIDRVELFLIPRLLGEGLLLFSWAAGDRRLTLSRSVAFSNGVVLLDYALQPRLAGQEA
jgi:dihydrofolate reductase